MIDTFQAVFLALVQGLTEFLPISSSAHLIIPSLLLSWPDQGLAFDVAVHVGTLLAVLFYYREDLLRMAARWFGTLAGAPACDESRMVWYIGLATMPAVAMGLGASVYIEGHFRTLGVIATTTLVFGLLLGIADRRGRYNVGSSEISLKIAVLVGCSQALALIPGVSRSGVTMTAALLMGLDRQASARFSFLLSIPVIAGAGLLKTVDLWRHGAPVDWGALALGAAVSGITAFLCITAFLRLLDKVGFMPFVYYRIGLAAILYVVWLN